MAQPKLLPPSMRSNKRYIAYEIISEQPVQYNEFMSSVWQSMFSFLGEHGAADARVWFVHNLYDSESQRGLIKCSHDSVEKLRVILSLIRVVSESKSIIHILGVTGTIKSARTKYLSQKDVTSFIKDD